MAVYFVAVTDKQTGEDTRERYTNVARATDRYKHFSDLGYLVALEIQKDGPSVKTHVSNWSELSGNQLALRAEAIAHRLANPWGRWSRLTEKPQDYMSATDRSTKPCRIKLRRKPQTPCPTS